MKTHKWQNNITSRRLKKAISVRHLSVQMETVLVSMIEPDSAESVITLDLSRALLSAYIVKDIESTISECGSGPGLML